MPHKSEKCLTFNWKIENANYCLQKKGEPIKSPIFKVDEIQETTWELELLPRGAEDGKFVILRLNRHKNNKGEYYVRILFELAFIAKDGSVLQSNGGVNYALRPNCWYGYLVKREDVFLNKRSEYLPQDTLTLRCKIWKCDGELSQDIRCFARTRVAVQKRSFLWKLENFSTLEFEKKCAYQMKSLVSDEPLISVNLSLTGGVNCDEIIRFELSLHDETVEYSTLRLYLVDASGTAVQCNQDEMWRDDLAKCKQFVFFFTRKQLMAKKSLYLSDDTLSLRWEWAFSKGIEVEEIEEIQYGCTTSESKISDPQNANNEKLEMPSHTLNDTLKSLYDENFLCDVKLKTNSSEFPAHKIILCASSSVFKAMFSNDMKEKNSDLVNIEDLSDDAVSRMLLYIYTSRVDDLTWESATHLYIAADKYAISSLKNICSTYLKDNLSPSNACEILLMSDLHADSYLKFDVQEYVLKHIKEIVNSDEWKILMETNAKLAAETVCLQYK